MVLDNVTRPLARALASPQLRGDEQLVDLEAPVIFAANHASHVDTPLLLACLPLRFRHRTVVAAAADYFFDRRWKADTFSFLLGAIPIERTKVNRRSADLAAELLADDWNLVIFPEGGRSPDGWAQEFRGGAAYLASRTGRPVVPGPPRRHPAHPARRAAARSAAPGPRSPSATPLWPAEGEDARRFGARIEAAVATLADESSTDWWTARGRRRPAPRRRSRAPTWRPWRRSWALEPAPTGPRPSTPRATTGRGGSKD